MSTQASPRLLNLEVSELNSERDRVLNKLIQAAEDNTNLQSGYQKDFDQIEAEFQRRGIAPEIEEDGDCPF